MDNSFLMVIGWFAQMFHMLNTLMFGPLSYLTILCIGIIAGLIIKFMKGKK